jgi:MoaA/NifB/PqqE/SkfB family radical SAM enzyme
MISPPWHSSDEESIVFDLRFAWLEITGKCPLLCEHCYADSGPLESHGLMATADWFRVIDQIVGLGGRTVQFIGGEPTLHPALPDLIEHARRSGLSIEIYTNLVRVTTRLWDAFGKPGVRLAVSYYSDNAAEHDSITHRRGSYERTKKNIAEAMRRTIPLRVGLVEVRPGQRVGRAQAELAKLGVSSVSVDRLRQIGRGMRDETSNVTQLCGACARGVVAISPNGEVWPCVFARWMPLGNVREAALAKILTSSAMGEAKMRIAAGIAMKNSRHPPSVRTPCDPRCCPNNMCDPQCSPSCSPSCSPAGNCIPVGNCAPYY